MMNDMDNIYKICNLIESNQNILILPHIFPDGDAIGSSIALYISLLQKGKNPYILLEDPIPQNLKFLPVKYIHTHLEEDFFADLIITVDCSDIGRLGKRASYLDAFKTVVNIDHHITNTYFGKGNLVVTNAAATGEIIYSLIKHMDISITKDIATCLYVAISADTGNFRYDNTTPNTHRIVAELLENDIELNIITAELYQNKPLSKIKLLEQVLSSLEMHYSNQIAILSVTDKMLQKSGAKMEDTDGLIEFARDIMGVRVGILLKEMNNSEIKVGFRSKDNTDVSKLAEKFGGGGHRKASGCTIYDTLENTKGQIVAVLKNHL